MAWLHRLWCRNGELQQLSAVQQWQKERVMSVPLSEQPQESPAPLGGETIAPSAVMEATEARR
jgi:hypothetical protein